MASTKAPLAVVLSYVFDWIVVIALAVGGGILNYINGFHRPFTLTDISIAYKSKPDIVSLPVLVLISLVLPAIIIAISLILSHMFTPSANRPTWRRTFWTIHASILALCFTLATTLLITSFLKDIVGKPRPNLLDRCLADPNQIGHFAVGGLGNSIESEAEVLVTSEICQQTNKRLVDDSFAAFPSGHSSFSTAGLGFLSLWMFAELGVPLPFSKRGAARRSVNPAPPLWQVVFALLPAFTALFVCVSRYADFHHAGIDIFAGAALGATVALGGFRLFHRPMRDQAYGLVYAPRERGTAFVMHAGRGPKGMSREEERGFELRERDGHVLAPERIDTAGTERPLVAGMARPY